MFHQIFWEDEVALDKFLKVISEWGMQEGNKKKLSKEWMQNAIAVHLLTPHIKPVSFGQVDEKMKMFREAISHFNITIFEGEGCGKLKGLWGDAEITKAEINRIRTEYQLASVDIDDLHNTDTYMLLLSKVLWLKNKCPLIVNEPQNIDKIIRLCPKKKIILLGAKNVPKSNSVFQNLSNLKKCDSGLCQKIIQNFTCSVQGKRAVDLKTLLGQNQNFFKLINTDLLLKMSSGLYNIGEEKQILVHPYIERLLKRNIVDIKFLSEVGPETIVVLNCSNRFRNLENYLKNHEIIYLDVKLEKNEEAENSSGQFHKSNLSGIAYITKSDCISYSDFEKIFSDADKEKIKSCHQFRVTENQHLEWIRSKGDVNDFERYRLNNECPIPEKVLWSSKPKNNINVIVSDPGMGKTELMKSFKENCSQKSWTLFITPEDVNSFLDKAEKQDVCFKNFILSHKYPLINSFDRNIFDMFFEEKNVNFVWDAVDEVLSEDLEKVYETILKFSKEGFVQWVTSRSHLKTSLQKKFSVMARDITQLTQEEQIIYMKERFNEVVSVKEMDEMIKKIQSTFRLVQYQDILGIPLQIFMLTELFRQSRVKYEELINHDFVLTDLYHHFIEEKMNIYFREKENIDLENRKKNRQINEEKRKILKHYEKVALTSIFENKILKNFKTDFEKDLRKVQKKNQSIGLITEFNNGIPKFFHNSCAEYFVAAYLSKNLDLTKSLKNILFKETYVNVRFFFDMLLAKNCKPHIDVLCKNFNSLKQCKKGQLQIKDPSGRNILHLACSWGQRYPELKVKKDKSTYLIYEDHNFNIIADSPEYCDMLESLLEKCNVSSNDELFNLTPLGYAKQAGCLTAEVKIMQKQNDKTRKSDIDQHVINMLYISAQIGYAEVLDLFINCDVVPYVKVAFRDICLLGLSVFHSAYLKELLKSNIYRRYINRSSINGEPLLHFGVLRNQYESAKVLLDNGIEIDKIDFIGVTAINSAATFGKKEFVRLLVTRGCDINIPSVLHGITPLTIASTNGYETIVKYLVESGAQIEARDKVGATALQHASQYGHEKIVKFLVESGAEINTSADHGGTPLMIASEMGHEKVVKNLVESGANVNHSRKDGATALIMAVQYRREKIVKFLVDNGAQVNIAGNNGCTALFLAAFFGEERIVGILINSGADVNKGYTLFHGSPIQAAFHNGHYNTVMKLLASGARCRLSLLFRLDKC